MARPTYAGYPPGVTEADIGATVTVNCSQCGATVDADDAVQAMGRDFCTRDECIADWAMDNIEEVLERIKD